MSWKADSPLRLSSRTFRLRCKVLLVPRSHRRKLKSVLKVIQGFHQPLLEGAMEDLIRARGDDILRFSHGKLMLAQNLIKVAGLKLGVLDVTGLQQDDNGVDLDVMQRKTSKKQKLRARWVIGADSANSSVRQYCSINFEDQGTTP